MTRPLRPLLLLMLLALAALAAAPALAAPAPQATGVALAARPAYAGAFRVGTWLPVVVELENSGVDRVVQVRVGAREGAQYAALVDLPSGGRKAVTVYAYMTPASRRLVVRLLDGEQELAAETLQLTPANQRARIVGLLAGQGAAVRPPARLPGGLPLVAVPLAPADLPDHPLGLGGLNALVVEDVPTAELRPAQREALAEWVARGGQLILGGGEGLAPALAGLPETLRPAEVAAVEPVPAASLLGGGAADGAVPLARLTPRPAADGRAPYSVPLGALAAGSTAALEHSLGRGSVVALALPLGHPALAAWEGAPRLWEELLRPTLELPPGFAPDTMTLDAFVEGNLASTLTSLPALEFPPLGPLAALVVAYIVLVGPVTYLVLRRLDRQALGWVVVPAITLLFAGLTYGLGYAQRGGDIVFNQVTLIEPVEGDPGAARVRTFVGLFSPERRDYDLQVSGPAAGAPPPLLRPISVQGAWDTSTPGGRGVYLQEAGAAAEARGFEVAQWSMRALAADSSMPLAGLTATLSVAGEALGGEVVNGTPFALRDVALIQGEQIARLGDLAPGERVAGELRRRQPAQPGAFGPTVPMSYLVFGEEMDRQSKIGGQPLPPDVQQRIRILDALYNYGPSPRGGQPLLLAWVDASALAVGSAEQRADYQQIALLSATPRVALAGGEQALGPGWLAPRFESGMSSVCFGGQGTGVTLGPEPAVMQLALPRDLYGLRASELSLLTASDGQWADSTQVELYDWAAGAWVAQPVAGRSVAVAEPARFLGGHGAVRVRITGGQPQVNFGCIYVDARIKGSLS